MFGKSLLKPPSFQFLNERTRTGTIGAATTAAHTEDPATETSEHNDEQHDVTEATVLYDEQHDVTQVRHAAAPDTHGYMHEPAALDERRCEYFNLYF